MIYSILCVVAGMVLIGSADDCDQQENHVCVHGWSIDRGYHCASKRPKGTTKLSKWKVLLLCTSCGRKIETWKTTNIARLKVAPTN